MISFLKKIAKPFFLSLFITCIGTVSFQKLNADIIVVNSEKFITLGSTKDEVLEILGTPSRISSYNDRWYFGANYLNFKNGQVSYFSDSKCLKIKLLPDKNNLTFVDLSNYNSDFSSVSNNVKSSGQSTTLSTSTKSKISVPSSSSASGYGEISKLTGRPKTVHVNGYYRKDGTYVKPHYRSPPRK